MRPRVHNIPPAPLRAFKTQRGNARRRGIPFLFSSAEWWAWWQVDGRWEHRGRRRGNLVMARYGDEGPYAPGNVYCTTPSGNLADVDPDFRRILAALAWVDRWRRGFPSDPRRGAHLRCRERHPRNRPVVTPLGWFPSAALAAEAHGITRQAASDRALRRREGWRYETDARSDPETA